MDLRTLYQEMILDHNRNPRHHHALPSPSATANGFNRQCGDRLTVYMQVADEVVQAISFTGCGCAISQASASLMTEALQGKTVNEAHAMFERFHAMLTQDTMPEFSEKWTVLAGVRSFPARVKCATLAWHTMEAALNQDHTLIVTE